MAFHCSGSLGPARSRSQLVTDASGSIGRGALWQARWLQWQWAPTVWSGGNELEEASITAAVWGPEWRDLNVIVCCDNMGAVAVVNTGYSKVPQIMHLLCCLFFIRAKFRFALQAIHIPG